MNIEIHKLPKVTTVIRCIVGLTADNQPIERERKVRVSIGTILVCRTSIPRRVIEEN